MHTEQRESPLELLAWYPPTAETGNDHGDTTACIGGQPEPGRVSGAPLRVRGTTQLAPHLLQTIRSTKAATEQQKPHARNCARIGEPHRISDAYLEAWLRICHARPDTNFYAYTKEVSRFRTLVEPDPPPNFLWVYSYGYVCHERRRGL